MSQPDNISYTSIPAQYGRLISTHIPCPNVSLSQFLQLARGTERFYWESAHDNVAFAGIGVAVEIMGYGADRFETVRHNAMELFADSMVLDEQEAQATPRLFGGFSFRDDFIPDVAWSDFPPAHFVLPHYQMTRVGDTTWLAINAHIPYGEAPISLLPDLKEALRAKVAELQTFTAKQKQTITQTALDYPMPFETWKHNIESATKRMKNGDFNKVVLSRVAEIRFDNYVDTDSALEFLDHTYPDTYRFLFEPRPYSAFYGATPELLATVEGHNFTTMALAGSIQRGNTPEEDKQYGDELLNNPKDSYEHQVVIDGIQKRLTPLAETLDIGETDIMTLSNIQHLHTPISATLKRNDGILPIVEALHPTPALGGDPREIAMEVIGEYESVPRGWYAAPVGWIDSNLDGQFGVAIRSAIAQEKRVWLYSGAGIVADSDPVKEWDETALKFVPMLNALGINT
ncbi:MAG: isochorismate synthase MenF [Phototrophicaceae bacterium]